jgi:hypothetical protein
MKIDTITIIASGVLLAAALLVLCAGHLRRRHHLRRLLVTDLLRDYFKGGMAAAQLGRRTREIASRHFTGSNEFYALTVSAFQRAIDANLAQQAATRLAHQRRSYWVGPNPQLPRLMVQHYKWTMLDVVHDHWLLPKGKSDDK